MIFHSILLSLHLTKYKTARIVFSKIGLTFIIINSFKKYLFGLIVSVYVISAAGIPIYLHYCGGTLEKINYVVKSKSCCGGEEEDGDDGCCKNENIILKNNADFTIKQFASYNDVKTHCELFHLVLPYLNPSLIETHLSAFKKTSEFPPPKLQNSLVISTVVLRI